MGQIVFRAIVGGIAGLIAWLIFEPQFARVIVDPLTGKPPDALWGPIESRFILAIGGLIGAAVGGVNGWMQGSKRHLVRGLLLGLVLGVVGISIGYRLGGGLLQAFFPADPFFGNGVGMGTRVLARVVVFLPAGAFLGLGIGAAGWTWRRVTVGGIGGLLGALVAGLCFDAASSTFSGVIMNLRGSEVRMVDGVPQQAAEVGQPGRALFAILMGLFIALFIGIVDRVTRTAWVRLVLGKNEGKEWVVDSPQTFMGRSEGAQIPLMGDPNVAPMHACIAKQGEAYMLMDGGSPIGTLLNGYRVQQAPLFDGAQIQIGPHVLLFQLRQGSAPQRASEALRGQAAQAQGMAPARQAAYQQAPYGMPPGQQTAAYPQNPAPYGSQPGAQQAPYGGQPGMQPPLGSQPGAQQAPYGGQPGMQPPLGSQQAPQGNQQQPGMPTQQQAAYAQPTTAFQRSFSLVALDGPLAGQRFAISGTIDMGREASGIRLGFDTSASRRHAEVGPNPDGVSVQDLGSTNGTFVNGQKVQWAVARTGDMLKVGSTTFRVEG